MVKDIQAMDAERLLNTAPEDLVGYFSSKFSIDVPQLMEGEISVEQREVKVDVTRDPERFFRDRSGPFYIPGTEVIVHVPFQGESEVFRIQPTTYSLSPPEAEVDESALTLSFTGVKLQADKVRAEVDHTLTQINQNLERLRSSADTLNAALPQLAREAIDARRKKLLADRNLVASLGFPIRTRTDSAKTFTAPEVRRKIAAVLPRAPKVPFRPEPALSEADYEHILKVVQSMAYVMERSPSAFASIDEEALRSHFLVQLNGQFEGQATGETFNYEGKTDILVRSGDRNIFIAECKFWSGPKKLTDTVDQLLGYNAWRDTKTAVILFSRNKEFSRVLDAIPPAVKAHPCFKRDLGKSSETVFRYIFGNKDDPNRELHLTVLAFDIPM